MTLMKVINTDQAWIGSLQAAAAAGIIEPRA